MSIANDQQKTRASDAARRSGAASAHPMDAMVRRAAVMAALIGWACGGPDAHDDAAALRADSSAAGYDVGPLASGNGDTAHGSRATRAGTGPGTGELGRRRDSLAASRRSPTDSAVVAAPMPATVVRPNETVVAPRDTTRPILIARVRVNEYLEYNPATRTAYLDIVATRALAVDSLSVAGDTLAFNGSRTGTHSVTVPTGWHIVGEFVNRDPVRRHSAIVIDEVYPLPNDPPPAAFPQAFTRGVEDGLATNARDEITFTASREGRFLIVCGVPGHAEGGQRMQFIVTSEVNVPAYGR